jgi:hypothetical protein
VGCWFMQGSNQEFRFLAGHSVVCHGLELLSEDRHDVSPLNLGGCAAPMPVPQDIAWGSTCISCILNLCCNISVRVLILFDLCSMDPVVEICMKGLVCVLHLLAEASVPHTEGR